MFFPRYFGRVFHCFFLSLATLLQPPLGAAESRSLSKSIGLLRGHGRFLAVTAERERGGRAKRKREKKKKET